MVQIRLSIDWYAAAAWGRIERQSLAMIPMVCRVVVHLVGMPACNLQTRDADHDSKAPRRRVMCMDGAYEVLGVVVGVWLCFQGVVVAAVMVVVVCV